VGDCPGRPDSSRAARAASLAEPRGPAGCPAAPLCAASLRSDGRRGRRTQDEIGADPPLCGRYLLEALERLETEQLGHAELLAAAVAVDAQRLLALAQAAEDPIFLPSRWRMPRRHHAIYALSPEADRAGLGASLQSSRSRKFS